MARVPKKAVKSSRNQNDNSTGGVRAPPRQAGLAELKATACKFAKVYMTVKQYTHNVTMFNTKLLDAISNIDPTLVKKYDEKKAKIHQICVITETAKELFAEQRIVEKTPFNITWPEIREALMKMKADGEKGVTKSELKRLQAAFTCIVGRSWASNEEQSKTSVVVAVDSATDNVVHLDPHNPVKQCNTRDDPLYTELKAAENKLPKRAAPLVAYLAHIQYCIFHVGEVIKRNKGAMKPAPAKSVMRAALCALALSLMSSRVSRSIEVLSTTLATLAAPLKDVASDLPLFAYVVLPSLWNQKVDIVVDSKHGAKDNGNRKGPAFLDVPHVCPPAEAAGMDLAAVFRWAMSVVLMVQPDYFDIKVNPRLNVFMNVGNGGKLRPADHNDLNSWLKQFAPPGAVRHLWLTGYSGRNTFAVEVDRMKLLLKKPEFVRSLFGHGKKSRTIETVYVTDARVSVYLDEDAEREAEEKAPVKRRRFA